MANTRTHLRLSLDVYNDDSQVQSGWTRIDFTDRSSGLFAAAYQKGNQIVIAFRGWDQLDPRDAPDIVRAYKGIPFEQIGDAQDFVDRVLANHAGAQVSLTGHSLGGALAAIMAVRNGLKAETFAAIESVGAAFNSMHGYETLFWDIPDAAQNADISKAALRNYGDVVNRLIFGEIATYNDETSPFTEQIGVDRLYGTLIQNGILSDDSLFGRYSNPTGKAFTTIVPSHVTGAPYSESFSTALHSLGFHALQIVFNAGMNALWPALPRLAFQLTNDRLARDADGGGGYRMTFDGLDKIMLDHLNAPAPETTVAEAMIADWQELAGAGAASVALSNPDINTALLQLSIEYGASQSLGDDSPGAANGILELVGDYLRAGLDGSSDWRTGNQPEGAHLIRDYAGFLLGRAAELAGKQIDRAAFLFAEAKDGGNTLLASDTGLGDLIFAGAGKDQIAGAAGGDVMFGLAGGDILRGGAGNDLLNGGNGADTITGHAGADIINGGNGTDSLTGSNGADSFVFATLANGTNGDAILDFEPGTDRIVLAQSVFTGIGGTGTLPAAAFQTGVSASQPDDRIIYDPVSGALLFDSDGSGGGTAVRFATLSPALAVTSADFLVL